MNTTPTKSGERHVWHVPSNSRPGLVHTVDIEAHDFWGACDCENYTIGKKGQHSKQTNAVNKIGKPSSTWCRHIREARKQHCIARASAAFLAAVEEIRPRK